MPALRHLLSGLVLALAVPSGATAQVIEPIRVTTPVAGTAVPATRLDKQRRTAEVVLSGQAAPGSELSISGECGNVDCQGLTYSDASGRWRTRLQLTTRRKRRDVVIHLAYWPSAGARTTMRVQLAISAARSTVPFAPRGVELSPGRRPLIVVGDSLAVGMAAPLSWQLPDWDVKVDASVGRPLAEGLQVVADVRPPPGVTVAYSLFTNDPPTDVTRLDAAVRDSVARLGRHGCAIWATISRRATGGVSYKAVNARLHDLAQEPGLAGRLLIVPWAETVAKRHGLKAPDHVHGTVAGYQVRAQLFADAARSCVA